jgi:integrase
MAPRLVRQRYTKVEGGRTVTRVARKWYGEGIPGLPPSKRVPLAADRAAAQRMLDDLVRGAERGAAGIPDAGVARTPLAVLLDRFRADLAAGLASRSRRKRVPNPRQVRLVVQQVRDALAGCGFAMPGDLDARAPAKLAAHLQRRVAESARDGSPERFSHQTAQFYLSAVGRFTWWLARQGAPVRADLFADVPGFEPRANRVHARREVTPAEFARLLEATRTGPARLGLTGEERYFLYLVAFSTGFRSGELGRLTPAMFDLDAGTVTLPARHVSQRTTRRQAVQPLPSGVAAQLRPWLAGKAPAAPVWPGKWSTGKVAVRLLRPDLEAAGVPYAIDTPEGKRYADFHSLRHSAISAVIAAGADVKTAQAFARHGSPELTIGVYAHSRPALVAAAAESIDPTAGGGGGDVVARMSREELQAEVRALREKLNGKRRA